MVSRSRKTTHVLDALTSRRARLAPVLQCALDGFATADQSCRRECGDVLDVLQTLDCDDETCASALWFYVAKGQPETWAKAGSGVSADVARLVGGQLAAERVWELHGERGSGGGEGLRRLLLAIIRDLRVVFVLLARQLARLRRADDLPADQAAALARLTADIHAPLANRLGIWQLKWELEDLAFRQLQPETYKRVAKLLAERRTDRE